MDLHIPVVFVVPLSLSYSVFDDADEESPTESAEESPGEPDDAPAVESPDDQDATASERPGLADREVFYVGLGDAVIPTVLVASAAQFATWAPSLGIAGFEALNLPALLAMGGILLGLFALLAAVMRGRAHAGLPLLNGGALVGYLVGALASGATLVQALGLAPFV